MKNASSVRKFRWQIGNCDNLEMFINYSFKLYMCQDTKSSSGVYRPKYQKRRSVFLTCLARRLSVFASRCGTDTAGRGALEPPSEDGARMKLFDLKGQFYHVCLVAVSYNLFAWHPSQVLAISRVLFVQALQTSSKTIAIYLVTCVIARAKTLTYWFKKPTN